MTQWEIWDKMMDEDEERRLRVGRWLAARDAKAAGKKKAEPKVIEFLLKTRKPGEGAIIRTPEGTHTVIYYDDKKLDEVYRKTPELLPQLLKELGLS